MASSNAAHVKVRSVVRGDGRPDVFDVMKADHERLRHLLAGLRESRDAGLDRRRQFDLLCDAVEAHGAAAEQSLYAVLLARAEDQRLARCAVDAHDEAVRLIDELSDLEMAGEAWQAGLGRLTQHLESQFRIENSETFPLARVLLGADEAARLADSYERATHQWVEAFGRLPAEFQPLPMARQHPVVPSGRGGRLRARRRPATWLGRLRRPLRAAGPSRSPTGR